VGGNGIYYDLYNFNLSTLKKLTIMTKKKASALLEEQMNASTQDNEQSTSNENMLKYVTIKNSPFTAIQLENERWALVMGDQLVTDQTFENVDEATQFVESKPWSLIMTAAYIYMDFINKNINDLKQENNDK
jgi:ElaB/YqjD/DUF883 family membrane-anchored ribosome-binding protein